MIPDLVLWTWYLGNMAFGIDLFFTFKRGS